MKRPVTVGLWVLGSWAAILFLFYSLIMFHSFRNRQKAEALLRDFKTLEVGVSTAEDVLLLVERYQGKQARPKRNADPNEITYQLDILPFLLQPQHEKFINRFGPYLGWFFSPLRPLLSNHAWVVQSSLTLQEDRLSGAGFEIFVVAPKNHMLELKANLREREQPVHFDNWLNEHPGYWVWGRNFKGSISLEAQLASESTLDDRRRAFDFNLSCLSSFGGCRSRCELMPSAWQDIAGHASY